MISQKLQPLQLCSVLGALESQVSMPFPSAFVSLIRFAYAGHLFNAKFVLLGTTDYHLHPACLRCEKSRSINPICIEQGGANVIRARAGQQASQGEDAAHQGSVPRCGLQGAPAVSVTST